MKNPLSRNGRLSAPKAILATALVLMLGACASTPPAPSAKMAVAEAAVQQANTTTNSQYAAAQLQIATAKLISARKAMADKDYVLADQLAEQTQLDARVAEIHAQSERSLIAAKESQDAARALREEISRMTNR